jgi:hypothetical protein
VYKGGTFAPATTNKFLTSSNERNGNEKFSKKLSKKTLRLKEVVLLHLLRQNMTTVKRDEKTRRTPFLDILN